jgi:hypothetical protein
MDSEEIKLLNEFRRWTITTHKNLRRKSVQINCKKGLWGVDAPDHETAEREAMHYFRQYYEDGEYK